jgi:hypothetical protein
VNSDYAVERDRGRRQRQTYGRESAMDSGYLKSRGAKSFRQRRHVSHSCAVPDDSK